MVGLKFHVLVAVLGLAAAALGGTAVVAATADGAAATAAAKPAVRRATKPAPPVHAHRRAGCVSQRGTIAVVQARRAVPLSAIRGDAERRGNGEIIGARLCHYDGRLVYFVSVLSERGKVVHLAFDAATGRVITAAR